MYTCRECDMEMGHTSYCSIPKDKEIASLRAEVERLKIENALARDTAFWLDCRWKEPSDAARGANECRLEGTHICARCLLVGAEHERDEALEGQDLLQRAFDETHQQVAKERDEALKRVEVYRKDGERLIQKRDEAQDRIKTLEATLNDIPCSGPAGCEALAQVAALLRDLSGVFDEFEHPKFYKLLNAPNPLFDKARALLDRLQRAEAVVKSQWEHRCSDGVGGCTAVSAEALAAWEER